MPRKITTPKRGNPYNTMEPDREMIVKLCGQDVHVLLNNDMWSEESLGLAREGAGEIWLKTDGISPTGLNNTFLHEAIHMILSFNGMYTETNNEVLVSALAAGLHGLLRDNKEVAEAIIEGVSLTRIAPTVEPEKGGTRARRSK